MSRVPNTQAAVALLRQVPTEQDDIVTTNEETSRPHPALIRPGRCLAAVEFPPFDAARVGEWLGGHVEHPMTLAELLERRGDLHRVVAGASSERIGQYL